MMILQKNAKMKNKNISNKDSLRNYQNKMNLKDIINMTMWYLLLGGILTGLGYILLSLE